MRIGLMIAIERELKAFLESGTEIREEQIGKRTVYRAAMEGHEVCAMLSGYGQIDAAATTQLLISCAKCEMILNFGVTGALDPGLKVEDLLVVEKVCHYDYDVSPIDPVKKHQYEEYPDEFIPLDRGLAELARRVIPEVRTAVDASGDRFVENREDKLELAALGCGICDMEIAAIARICERNGVPCLSLKCISDTFDGDGGDFNANVTRSAEKAFRAIHGILRALPAHANFS